MTAVHPFADALHALHRLLDAAGERRWRDWIALDIDLWETEGRVDHHRLAYGGMGSLGDLILSPANGHTLTDRQARWVAGLLDDLRRLCSALAAAGGGPLAAADLATALGRPFSDVRGLRCARHGHACAAEGDVEAVVAAHVVRRAILRAATEQGLEALVEPVLRGSLPGVEAERERVTAALREADVSVVRDAAPITACPVCGDTRLVPFLWSYPYNGASLRLIHAGKRRH